MNHKKKIEEQLIRLSTVTTLLFALVACQSNLIKTQFTDELKKTDDISAVLSRNTGVHIVESFSQAEAENFVELAAKNLLKRPFIQQWLYRNKLPKVIIGELRNNTDNDNIDTDKIYQVIERVIFNSGLVRLADLRAVDYDYTIRSEITSTRQYGGEGKELVVYKLKLRLFTLNAEYLLKQTENMAVLRDIKMINNERVNQPIVEAINLQEERDTVIALPEVEVEKTENATINNAVIETGENQLMVNPVDDAVLIEKLDDDFMREMNLISSPKNNLP